MKQLARAVVCSRLFQRPISMTYSVTGRCNSRCRTCRIWGKKPEDMPAHVWKKIFSGVGRLYWAVISGGEPFLRKDFTELLLSVAGQNRPRHITIATNGTLAKKAAGDLGRLRRTYRQGLNVNVSIDAIGEKHDRLRGMKCFDSAVQTCIALMGVADVSIHTVVSAYNPGEAVKVAALAKRLGVGHIFQPAENRKELGNLGQDVGPKEYFSEISGLQYKGLRGILRKGYHSMLRGRRLRCYAGRAFAHVNYDGELWGCAVKCQRMGNLAKEPFEKAWNSAGASEVRAQARGCRCELLSAYYANLAMSPWSAGGILLK